MTNEIKEISIRSKEQQAIDVFKEFIETKGNLETDYSIETYMQIILDYITNLQEKVNQYENPDDMTLFYMWLDAEAKDKMKQLQKENERLKEVAENLTTMTVCGDRKQIKNTAQYKLEQAQSRIDKAIEYINKHPVNACHNLLNILQGEDKE